MPADPGARHLEGLRRDARDEIKRRILQRDRYSNQLTISLAAVVALAFSKPAFVRALIVAPLVALYFTALILYSYRVHRLLAAYLREGLEPEMARRAGTSADLEWETWYRQHAEPGIRGSFFVLGLWCVTGAVMGYLFAFEATDRPFLIALSLATVLYLGAGLAVTLRLGRPPRQTR